MGVRLRQSALEGGGPLEQSIEVWSYLDEGVLRPSRSRSRSRKVCMTCHFFRQHAGVNCIPLLTCQLHQGWAPEVA